MRGFELQEIENRISPRKFQLYVLSHKGYGRGNFSGQGLKKPPFHGSSQAHRDKPGGSPVGSMWDARKNCHA